MRTAPASEPSHQWLTDQHDELFATIASFRGPEQMRRFLRDLCTPGELDAMAQRWEVAKLVNQGVPYLEISKRTGASTATVTRVAQWLHHGEGGYLEALRKQKRRTSNA
jgi:TrpR-related protein YerC/YecD